MSNRATNFLTSDGAAQIGISIRGSMEEMVGWSPDRLAAFFAGLAKGLAEMPSEAERERAR